MVVLSRVMVVLSRVTCHGCVITCHGCVITCHVSWLCCHVSRVMVVLSRVMETVVIGDSTLLHSEVKMYITFAHSTLYILYCTQYTSLLANIVKTKHTYQSF